MTAPAYLDTPQGRRLAYHRTDGAGPGVVFLGGFMSDMTGTKAQHLEAWARARGQAFLRFDYSGHGQSSGAFAEGCIGDWAQDAETAITALTDGPQVLVGSSMGGWIALLLARALPERVVGLVGIAAAPDFTEDSMWASFAEDQRATIMGAGRIEIPSGYDDSPYTITRRLIEDGRENLVLRDPLRLPFPVRLLQGTADEDVEVATALRLLDHIDCADARLTLVKGADHRFSEPDNLALVEQAISELLPA
ncbi:alpha/beta hydrolase [Rhodovulum adriaticum]|uniref:Palmitoyl-protein thioesterase ABHD10, mitochondrial n=1 Tax=Rhodovulum adriaticum TaxID=35804 RepID=A0A4R2NIL4_RHOAD|nr:alpha/beta hydrolase [Rhodovulum adriaticum]MBK1634639.1 alpha/beta hydrolase [Rhodovulum adriaticum]TCP21267.1 pimeloyl-ACP methyl ester carboxylesterase [Rhodovulum adriaticum]